MFRTILHSVLLMAVAYSQILGGVSCCCLGRSFLESISGKQPATAEADVASSKSLASQPARCPKGTARPTVKTSDSVRSAAKSLFPSCLICQGAQCICSKQVLSASEPPKSVSVPAKSIAWACVAFASIKPTATAVSSFGKFEVPIRFGGHSWQSIACVWRN